jgi:hypothetical protein
LRVTVRAKRARAAGCPQRFARCVAIWCDAQRRLVERCDAPGRVALPTLMSISPTRLIDYAKTWRGREATSRQRCCRIVFMFVSDSMRSPCIGLAQAEWLCRTADRDRSGASVWTTSLSRMREICAGFQFPMLLTATLSERIGRCTRMRRFFVRFNRSEAFVHTRSSVGFTIITSGFDFSVHTGQEAVTGLKLMALAAQAICGTKAV